MPSDDKLLKGDVLKVYEAGELTVVGFGGKDVLDDVNVADFRDEVSALVKKHGCKVLAVDLTGVTLIPSGLLGLLASLRQLGIDVHIYNPSDDVRDVLEVTKLNEVFQIHEVGLSGP